MEHTQTQSSEATSANPILDALIQEANLEQTCPIAGLGGGWRVIKSEKVRFTAKFAEHVLGGLQTLPYDRGYNNNRIRDYVRCMKEGTFLPEQTHIDVCDWQGSSTLPAGVYRLNGQHVSWARCEFPSIDPEFDKAYHPFVVLNTYKVATENDLRILYANLDRSLPRNNNAIANSYLYGTPEFAGVSKATIKALAFGIRGWKFGFDSKARTSVGINELCYHLRQTDYEVAMRVANFLTVCGKRKGISHITRGPCYAAMFATFNRAKEASEQFWAAVRDGNDLGLNDPRLKLRNMLTTHAVNDGATGKVSKVQTTNSEEMYRWCLEAWKAFREGREIKSIKTPKDRPVA